MQCCLRRFWTTFTRQYSHAVLSQYDRYNIAWVIFLIKGPNKSRQHFRLFFWVNLFVGYGQKCTSNFLVQCWLRQIKITLYMVIFQRIGDYVVWAKNALVVFLCKVVSNIFGQYWVYNIHMQCCPSLIDTTFYRFFYSEKLSVNHRPTLHR